MKRHTITCMILAALFVSTGSFPQEEKHGKIVAAAGDVQSVDAILASLYDVISGPAGEARDWGRFYSLFHPEARLIMSRLLKSGGARADVMAPEDYAKKAGPYLEDRGFFEREIHRCTERFGSVSHIFSTYECRYKAEDPKPFTRGINSIQLFHDSKRWWVVTVFWDAEPKEKAIPEKYLPAVNHGQSGVKR